MDNVSGKDTISSDNTTKDENEDQMESLTSKISKLENESKQFDAQRAKMTHLFIQKEDEANQLRQANKLLEDELNAMRCQYEVETTEKLRQDEELESLRQLLNDTLEESTKREGEVKVYQQKLDRYESEIAILKSDLSDQKQILGTPGAVLSNFAKKVVSQLGASDSNQSHESLDESMRKAKEDTDFLKSLLIPLEDQIKQLTTKLAISEDQLARYKNLVDELRKDETMVNGLPSISSSDIDVTLEDLGSVKSTDLVEGCDKCQIFEAQLVQNENKLKDFEKQIVILERYKDELAKETATRKQMEEKWIEKKELHKNQVAELQEKLKYIEGALIKCEQIHLNSCSDLNGQFKLLSAERRETQDKLERLQKENDNLVGKHSAHSTELQNATINLPDNVEELQEMWLKQCEDLITAKVAFERSEESVKSLDRICKQLKQEQLDLTTKHSELIVKKEKCEKLLENKNSDYLAVEKKSSHLISDVERLKSELATVNEEKKQLEESELELKNRLASMQSGLEQGEAVQKDFVLLSQNLQKELEHLRVQNHVLRWEYAEDVTQCRGCEKSFESLNKSKDNCKHCGRVFCSSCLSNLYVSPITRRKSPVCKLCHTLLDHHTPPFFSTDPPK